MGSNAQQLSFNITDNIPNARNSIDAITFSLIKEKQNIKCPMCSSSYYHDAANTVCENCKLSTLGQEYLGLKFSSDYN